VKPLQQKASIEVYCW